LTSQAIDIDGVSLNSFLRPHSMEELEEMLASVSGGIVPIGSQTQLHFGNPLRTAQHAVDLSGMSGMTEYNPADLTIHVEAGVTLEQLQSALLKNNQFLPLDPWGGSTATIGGIAATNAQGPYRAAGSIRDWIIGMRVVHADGRMSKTGGRVVKNVTGYDLAKLYTGSIGSLAIIAEISLKLRTNFAKIATVIAKFEDRDQAASVVAQIRKGPLNPISCEWVGPDNSVWLRFGEHAQAVDWQLNHLPSANWTREEEPVWEKLRAQYNAMGPIVIKVVALPTQLSELLQEIRPAAWIAHALNGIVLMTVSGVEDIRRIRTRYRGVIEKAPVEVRREIGTFGLNAAEYRLMKKMKDAFDPAGRLNPGRHVDGEPQS
jgi:glycolate oxidase FAD binding subunit